MTLPTLEELDQVEKAATPDWVYEPERYSALCVVGIKPRDDRWLAHFQPEMNGGRNGQCAVASRNSLRALLDIAFAARELAKLRARLVRGATGMIRLESDIVENLVRAVEAFPR